MDPNERGKPRIERDPLTGEEYYAGKRVAKKVTILFLASTACLICTIGGTLYYMAMRMVER